MTTPASALSHSSDSEGLALELSMEQRLAQSRQAAQAMATLTTAQKNRALLHFAELIRHHQPQLLAANQLDRMTHRATLAPNLLSRLKLDTAKLTQLLQGIEDVVRLPDPTGQTLSKRLLDDGLTLSHRTVPLGVLAIIFESRPDVLPQILSLVLKSGNAVVFKGGSEARATNQAFMQLVNKLSIGCPFLPPGWATLLETRDQIAELLQYPQYVDLVIPRGSNELVQRIMSATRIPVLGHADGVCHLYVHASADLAKSLSVIVDAKTQYPAACNALETLLVDRAIASEFLPQLSQVAQEAGIHLRYQDEGLRPLLGNATWSPDLDWHTEYGDQTLAVGVTDSVETAIEHINHYGSHHTDGILATDAPTITRFLNGVDSASVFVNASTRFADGFRYGLGAEIGISTSRTHARGPVGLEGLISTQWVLQGDYQVVRDYTGEQPTRTFRHESLPVD